MKTITVNLYEYDELSDEAKSKAREWYREGALDYGWWDSTYDDAAEIGLKITGFEIDRNRHATGKLTKDATECADLIIANHGESCDTRKLAESFLLERDEIVSSAEQDGNGGYVNERALDLKLDACESEFERALIEEYSIILQKEYEYLMSDESVDESIRANEYTFTEAGRRQG